MSRLDLPSVWTHLDPKNTDTLTLFPPYSSYSAVNAAVTTQIPVISKALKSAGSQLQHVFLQFCDIFKAFFWFPKLHSSSHLSSSLIRGKCPVSVCSWAYLYISSCSGRLWFKSYSNCCLIIKKTFLLSLIPDLMYMQRSVKM